jgi:hypothetical protein
VATEAPAAARSKEAKPATEEDNRDRGDQRHQGNCAVRDDRTRRREAGRQGRGQTGGEGRTDREVEPKPIAKPEPKAADRGPSQADREVSRRLRRRRSPSRRRSHAGGCTKQPRCSLVVSSNKKVQVFVDGKARTRPRRSGPARARCTDTPKMRNERDASMQITITASKTTAIDKRF